MQDPRQHYTRSTYTLTCVADQSQLASVVLRAVGLNGGVDAFGGNVLWNNMEIG